METTEEMEFNILREFLSGDEIDHISNKICIKLESLLGKKFDDFITAKAVFETNRKNLDEKLTQLTKNCELYQSKLKDCEERLNLAGKYTTELQNQLDENIYHLNRLQESIQRLEKENNDLRKLKDMVSDENNTLHSQVDRKNIELERLRTELTSLGSQLQSAVAAKCQALAEVEEFQSREISLDFKEKRFEQERTLLSQQIAGLEEELSKRTAELQNTRSETSARVLLINTRLSQYEEEIKIKNESEVQLREANCTLQHRCEEMVQKLEDQRNHELATYASYREEVMAQTRLADLYKGMSDEANAKADDYSNAVKELQDLLEHATEQYGILESKHNQIVLNHEQEIRDNQKKINDLSKELDDANELLKLMKQERLDQAVEQLAPTAAIASKILKKGLSLTQIYTQLVEVTNELSLEKEENEKLKSQMEIIFKEVEEKAPILQQQREDYEAAVANVTTLTLRLEELLNENYCLQKDTDEAKKFANHYTRENQRLKNELADLARQVCYLLKEVQESRTGNSVPASEFNAMETDNFASSQIISKKLVTFKDIEGLQENNQKLLSIVRTLSSKQEEIEKATDQINSGEMKEKLDRYIEQLSEMQAAQDRQTKMLEGLLKQRDMYKNMYQQCISQTSALKDSEEVETQKSQNENMSINDIVKRKLNESEKMNDEIITLHKKCQDSEIKFNQISKDFDIYKKEKIAHEQMLNDEIERLHKDAEKNSNRCCRLKAQLDSANERFSLLQGNVVSYKSQIKILEEKCMNYNTTIGKHEQSLMILKDEALAAQSRLSKAEVQLENLKHERQLLRDSESRLLKEREVLQRERHTHALLKADVESIKASLERTQAEGQIRMEQRLDDATRECTALRRRLQEEQDRFRELSMSLERQVSTLQKRLTEEKTLTERIQLELGSCRLAEQEYIRRIEELNMKLKQAAANVTSKTIEALRKKLDDATFQTAQATKDADHLLVQTAATISTKDKPTIIVSEDVDVLVILMQFLEKSKENIYFMKPNKGNVAEKIYNSDSFLYPTIKHLITFIHAFSGCDCTSAFFNKGKIKIVKILLNNPTLALHAATFYRNNVSTAEIEDAGIKIILSLYAGKKCTEVDLNSLQYSMFKLECRKQNFNLASLPPTESAANFHCRRVYYQVQQWLGNEIDATKWGWKIVNDTLEPIHTNDALVPDTLLLHISCKCTKKCGKTCSCVKHELKCSEYCANCNGQNCNNAATVNSNEIEFDLDDIEIIKPDDCYTPEPFTGFYDDSEDESECSVENICKKPRLSMDI